MHAWRAPALTKQGNQAIYVQIDERINRYEMNIFVVDEITGRMYTKIGGKLHSIPEIASHRHQEEPALMPGTDKQDQISARERALGKESVSASPYYRGTHGNSLNTSCWDEPISSRQASGDIPFRDGCLRCCYGAKEQRFTTYWHN